MGEYILDMVDQSVQGLGQQGLDVPGQGPQHTVLHLKGEDSLVGEVRNLVGEAGPGDLKLRLLTCGAGPDLEMEWWRSGESLTEVA